MKSFLLILRVACPLIGVGQFFADAGATGLIVPDDAPSVGAALLARPDTVYLRSAAYREAPVVSYPVVLTSFEEGLPRASLDSLVIQVAPNRTGSLFEFKSIAIRGRLKVVSDNGSCDFHFTDCELKGGLADYSQYGDTRSLSLAKCQLDGSLDLWANAMIVVDSCHVTGNVSANGPGPDLMVRGCVFDGDGTGAALRGERLTQCDIVANQVHDYSSGLAAVGDYTSIRDNTVTDCWIMGIGAGELLTSVENNTVVRCGRGIVVETSGRATVTRNRISGCSGDGISVVWGDRIELLENVIWDCGGNGVVVRGAGSLRVMVIRNTICLNGGSAFVIEDAYSLDGQEWNGNIAYMNSTFAVQWLSGGEAHFACNDWVGNQLGAVVGRPPSDEDVAVDPKFCEPETGDFRLQAVSPLVGDSICGQIGALGEGCGVTPALVERFAAARVGEGVRVVWELAPSATTWEVWLERSGEASEGPWIRPITERSLDNRVVIELDRSAAADRAYWYRLVALDGGTSAVIGSPIRVEARAPLECRLTEVGPSPGSVPLRIVFALKHAATVEIDVFDIQGRRVASPGRGAWTAGMHEVMWDGRGRNGQPAPAGMYIVRYAYPGGQDRRAVVRAN